jgi:DNA polymerase V
MQAMSGPERVESGCIARALARTKHALPLVLCRASAGFPSPADDYLDRPLDFNELLIENPDATFAVRVVGDSMIGAGIFPGDIAVVDRSKTARDKSIVLAVLDGEFTLKRYRQRGERHWLEAENESYGPIELTEDSAFEIWGVIQRSIRML